MEPCAHVAAQVCKQLAVVSSWQAAAVAHTKPITALATRAAGEPGSLVASCDGSGRLLLWHGPHLQRLAAVPSAATCSTAALAWLPLQCTEAGADSAKLHGWLAVGSGSLLQCYAISSKHVAAMATAALPAGCSSIKSLHALKGQGGTGCRLVAVCSNSAGRGSMLCGWQCLPMPGGSGLQLHPVSPTRIPAVTSACTAAATAGDEQLLLGTADGAVLMVAVSTGSSAQQTCARLVSLQEQGHVQAVAADDDCLHIATCSGRAVSIWTAAKTANLAVDDGAHYSILTCAQLPPAAGQATAVAWLRHSAVPCAAVATSSGSILMLATMRQNGEDCSHWHWAAHLPATAGGVSSVDLLTAGSGCGSVMVAAGSEVLRLADSVLLPSGSPHQSTQLLGRCEVGWF